MKYWMIKIIFPTQQWGNHNAKCHGVRWKRQKAKAEQRITEVDNPCRISMLCCGSGSSTTPPAHIWVLWIQKVLHWTEGLKTAGQLTGARFMVGSREKKMRRKEVKPHQEWGERIQPSVHVHVDWMCVGSPDVWNDARTHKPVYSGLL